VVRRGIARTLDAHNRPMRPKLPIMAFAASHVRLVQATLDTPLSTLTKTRYQL
jgi:hypothetical protein